MQETCRIIIAGCGDFTNYPYFESACDRIIKLIGAKAECPTIISGAAHGADELGERYAAERGYRLVRFKADWNTYGKAAGPMRNKQMAYYAAAPDKNAH